MFLVIFKALDFVLFSMYFTKCNGFSFIGVLHNLLKHHYVCRVFQVLDLAIMLFWD